MILHRYFARRFLFSFLGVFVVFLLIMLLADLVEQLRRFGREDAAFVDILTLTLLNVPRAVYRILPLVMILSAIALFLNLARSSELVVTRAAGRSALRALLAPLAVALGIGIFAVAVMNPIVAGTSKQFEVRSDALKGETSTLSIASSGFWLRQGNLDGQTVIRAQSTNLDGTQLTLVTFLTSDRTGTPTRRIEAQSALLADNAWQLKEAKVWQLQGPQTPEATAEIHATLSIPSSLTPDQIRDSFGTPSSIPIWELPAFIDRLTAAGFSARRHLVWFHGELALPIFMFAMVMIGATFTLRHQRGGRTGLMVMLAIVMAFLIYFVRNFAQVLGENGQIPPVLAAWVPPVAAIGLSLSFLLHNEDG